MNMTVEDAEDRAVDALLRSGVDDDIADDGFTAAVMQRVQATEVQQRVTLDAVDALARWRRRRAAARRDQRWRQGGAAAGVLVAAVQLWLGGSLPMSLQPPQVAALVFACAAAAWALAASVTSGD
jgi:hypothetical protein